MRTLTLLARVLVLVIAAWPLLPTSAFACGGCFHAVNETESTQVTSHRMVLSISQQQTTLWDQVEYVGAPADFAWVLPVHGAVTVGVSSDLFFTKLDDSTSVVIDSPKLQCSGSQGGGYSSGTCNAGYAATGTGGGSTLGQEEGVTVIQQAAVGPYDTVQLASQDPLALRNWLAAHGYAIPADVSPTIDAYVNEGFDFLAVRLAPGNGVQAMQPIRVTFPGASPSLPLRMVSAGTGSNTAITLWVIGEGRYTTTSMPTSVVDANELVWDWGMQRSNYSEVVSAKLAQNGGAEWLVASAIPVGSSLFDDVVSTTQADPVGSGYGGASPVMSAYDDMAAAIGAISSNKLFVTRLYAVLPRAALSTDLAIGASTDTSSIPPLLTVTATTGIPPCQTAYLGCGSGTGAGPTVISYGGQGGEASADSGIGPSGGCALGGPLDASGSAVRLGLVVAIAGLLRRARGRRALR